MMHMTLYWGTELTLLFSSWRTTSWPGYALALLLCFLISLLYQRLLRLKSNPSPPSINSPLIARKLGRNWRFRLALAASFGANSAVGYLIMLAVMSYNGGVLVAVVLGMTVGCYLFTSGDSDGGGDDDDDCLVGADTSRCGCS